MRTRWETVVGLRWASSMATGARPPCATRTHAVGACAACAVCACDCVACCAEDPPSPPPPPKITSRISVSTASTYARVVLPSSLRGTSAAGFHSALPFSRPHPNRSGAYSADGPFQ